MNLLFYLAIFLSPFMYMSLYKNFTASDFLFFICFIIIITNKILKNEKINKFNKLMYTCFFGILLSYLFSIINSKNVIDSFQYFVQLVFIFFVLGVVILEFIKEEKQIVNIMGILYITVLSTVCYSIIADVFGFATVATSYGRHVSVFKNPWIFSFVISIVLPLAIYYVRISQGKWKALHIFFFLLLLYGLVLSGARTGFLTLLVMISLIGLVFLLRRLKKTVHKVTLLITLSILFLFAIFNLQDVGKIFVKPISLLSPIAAVKLESLFQEDIRSIDSSRYDMYVQGIEYLKESPILGMGIGQFNEFSQSVSMHNYFLSIWIEGGIFAFLIILTLHVIIFKILLQKKGLLDGKLRDALLLLNIVFLFFVQFNPVLFLRFYWLPLLLSLAAIKVIVEKDRNFKGD